MNKATLKRTVVLALVAIMLFSVMLPAASAETTAVTGKTTAKVYFRQNPTSTAKPYVVGCNSIPKGAEVQVLGFIGSFYQVSYKGYTGYVKNTELAFSGADATAKELLYFRSKATSSSSLKYRVAGCPEIPRGAAIKIVGASGSYSKVQYNGYTGYVRTVDLAVAVTDLTPKLESYTITEVGPYAGKTITAVNFRQFPEKSTLLVTKSETIKKGKAVTVTGECGDFYRITYAGYTGFAYKADVSVGALISYTVTPVDPAKTGTTLDVVNFRSYPVADSDRIPQLEKIKKGVTVTVTGTVGEFYQISYGGYTGFGYQKDVRLTDGSAPTTGNTNYTVTPIDPAKTGTTLDVINFRVNPEANSSRIPQLEKIKKGVTVTVVGTVGEFYQITYGGYTGFGYIKDVKLSDGTTTGNTNYTVTPINPAKTGTTLDVINFRVNPEANSSRIPQLEKIKRGVTVSVVGTVGEFYQITYGGYTGFGYIKDVELNDGATTGNTTATIPSGAPTEVAAKMSAAYAKNNDVVGYIYIPNTKIDYPIYNNRYDSKKKDFVYNLDYDHIFTMANQNASGIACIMGHNMRTSLTMFHYLHHVQNRLLGKSTCEKCGKSVSSISNNTVFTILYDGYSYYQLFAMYETKESEPKTTLSYNALNSNASGSAKQAWIDYSLMRSQLNFGVSVSANDKLIVLVTCGDKVGGTTGARLYMCLKAVG